MLIEDIIKYLEENQIGTFKKDLFGVAMPSSPANVICVYDGIGSPADRYNVLDNPGIQIIVRNSNYKAGYEKAYKIYNLLHCLSNKQLGGFYILGCYGQNSPPGYIGPDNNGNHEFSLNFNLDIRRN